MVANVIEGDKDYLIIFHSFHKKQEQEKSSVIKMQ